MFFPKWFIIIILRRLYEGPARGGTPSTAGTRQASQEDPRTLTLPKGIEAKGEWVCPEPVRGLGFSVARQMVMVMACPWDRERLPVSLRTV